MTSLKDLEKSIKLIRDNSIYGLPMYKLDDKTYEYCRNDAIDAYRYLYEYMGVKPSDKPVTATELLEESRRNNIMTRDDEVYLVQWNKSAKPGESSINILGKMTRGHINEECECYTVGNVPNGVALRGPSIWTIEGDVSNSPWDVVDFSRLLKNLAFYADAGARSDGKTKLVKEMLNSMYGTKAFKYDIEKVIFSGPCTIVFWQDGTKTMVRQQKNDILDKEKGLAMAIAKRVYGDKGNYNNIFKRWLVGKDWRKKERLAKKTAKENMEIRPNATEIKTGTVNASELFKWTKEVSDEHSKEDN